MSFICESISSNLRPVSFPKVGVIGAGQLARMMAIPANDLGIELTVFAASPDDSAAQVLSYTVGDYTDAVQILAFAQDCDVITFAINGNFKTTSPPLNNCHAGLGRSNSSIFVRISILFCE